MPISDINKHVRKCRNESRKYIESIKLHAWFAHLPTELQNLIVKVAEIKHYAHGECIVAADRGTNGMYCVMTGMVFMTTTTASSRTTIPLVVNPHHWFGLIEVMTGSKYPLTAIAAKDTKLIFIQTEQIESICRQRPEAWRDIGRLLADQTMILANNIVELIYSPAPIRLAKRLAALSKQEHGTGSFYYKRTIHVSHDQLGSMLSISRQMTCRILKEFEKCGLIRCGYNCIEITDMNKLRSKFNICDIDGLNFQKHKKE